jgi:hypothetical protein
LDTDDRAYFKAIATCPACDKRFEHLRVREVAVHPTVWESDFRIIYATVDPSIYAVLVCPNCCFASYRTDFETLAARERASVLADERAREKIGGRALQGMRTIRDSGLALNLAIRCSRVQGRSELRIGGLLHRRAWIERALGNRKQENELLTSAVECYTHAFEHDATVSRADEGRLAYLIGDLTVRLDLPIAARRWFLEAASLARSSDARHLEQLARNRLLDAKEAQRAIERGAPIVNLPSPTPVSASHSWIFGEFGEAAIDLSAGR